MDMEVPCRFFFCKCSSFTGFKILGSVQTAEELDQFGNQACPAGLVARPQPSAVVSVEVLVEQDVILPLRAGLEFLRASIHRRPARLIAQEAFESTDWQFLVPLQTDSSFCPSRSDTQSSSCRRNRDRRTAGHGSARRSLASIWDPASWSFHRTCRCRILLEDSSLDIPGYPH